MTWATAACMASEQIDQSDMFNRGSVGLPILGKVHSSDDLAVSMLRIQILDMGSRSVYVDMPLGLKGAFQLPPLPIGFYDLRIVGPAGEVKHLQELHTATSGFVDIQLKIQQQPRAQNSISAIRLMHETPKKARKELDAATRAFKKGDRATAIEHLEKAAESDPENFDVASNLGALYLQERNPEKAVPWLEKAHRIDPFDAGNNINYSAYYANLGEYAKAEDHANAGLKADPASVRGRFMLAVALVKQGKNVDSARAHLDQIQNQFAPARSLLMTLMPRQ